MSEEWGYIDELGRILEWLEPILKANEAAFFADAETQLATQAPTWPMPNNSHPSLVRHADFVRQADLDTVRLPGPLRFGGGFLKSEEPFPSAAVEVATLQRRLAWAPAPFTGPREGAYIWPVWSDEYSRTITGDVTLIWR